MPASSTLRYPELGDRRWLSDQLAAGRSAEDIAAQLGTGTTTVRTALRRLDLDGRVSARHGEPRPQRRFVPLADRLEAGDLDVDVAPDELARRLAEGLTDLAALAELAECTSRDALWDLVVSQVAPATARAVFHGCGSRSRKAAKGRVARVGGPRTSPTPRAHEARFAKPSSSKAGRCPPRRRGVLAAAGLR
jgi:hypothetical protein